MKPEQQHDFYFYVTDDLHGAWTVYWLGGQPPVKTSSSHVLSIFLINDASKWKMIDALK